MSGEAAKVLVDKWLQENGFNEEGYTYIYFPKDSYDVKEELKIVYLLPLDLHMQKLHLYFLLSFYYKA